MNSTRRHLLTMGLGLALSAPLAALAEAPKCEVCSMKVDHAHRFHLRYAIEGKQVEICALTCAHRFWAKNKDKKMTFQAMDFATGKFVDANKGVFLLGSKLKIGTGMDKTTVVFFADPADAEKARKVNGGQIVRLEAALKAAAR